VEQQTNGNAEQKPDEGHAHEYVLVNIVETLVKNKAKDLIKTIDMCQCNKCYLDACAIVLNNLEPLYVTTRRGELLSRVETIGYQYQSKMMIEVLKALNAVRKSPRH